MKCQAGGGTSCNQDCWDNINNLMHADGTTLMEESDKGTKEPLDECERGE